MFRQSRYASVNADDFAALEQRIQDLERRLVRATRTTSRAASGYSSDASQAAQRIGDSIVTALTDFSGRVRGGARSVGDEADRWRQDVTRVGNAMLRRVSAHVEHRPFVLLAVAVGVGLLAGLAMRRD
jgi:ElaB/YqjD/DUF883 family membrane-anchored ribosome-binding protein